MCILLFVLPAIVLSQMQQQQQQQQQQGHNYIIASTNHHDFTSLFGAVLLIGLLTAAIISVIGMGIMKFISFKKTKKVKREKKHSTGEHVCHHHHHPHHHQPIYHLKPVFPVFPVSPVDVHTPQDIIIEMIKKKFTNLLAELDVEKLKSDTKLQDMKKEYEQTMQNLREECSREMEKLKTSKQEHEPFEQFHKNISEIYIVFQEQYIETNKRTENEQNNIMKLVEIYSTTLIKIKEEIDKFTSKKV